MKILHINTNDLDGGAARAAYRIHQGLVDLGQQSRLFVARKHTDDKHVFSYSSRFEKLEGQMNQWGELGLKAILKVNSKAHWSAGMNFFSPMNKYLKGNMDIVHLHWINGGFISLRQITKIKVPIVWTLHDSWPFTGGCHIPYACREYEKGCEDCLYFRKSFFKFNRYLFYQKKKVYRKGNMMIVCPSKWLAECASRSALFGDKEICVIPNGLDVLHTYRPIEKTIARKLSDIGREKKVILFCAMGATSDENKGFSFLYQALKSLKETKEEIEIIVLGGREPKNPPNFGFPTHYMGRIHDDMSLRILYVAADVVIIPSKSENLPNVIIEAMACGTPCVAFRIGGIPDIIHHKMDGYLAEPYDVKDLTRGIEFILNDMERWKVLGKNARKKVVENFDIRIVAKQYQRLYERLLH